mmetsp:Transcript_112413/g.223354  ORF Transcript_112413/g.223354 Transcript_112413/m.223354 type:complete len:444 (+) Transcript_112413:76-1407(+)
MVQVATSLGRHRGRGSGLGGVLACVLFVPIVYRMQFFILGPFRDRSSLARLSNGHGGSWPRGATLTLDASRMTRSAGSSVATSGQTTAWRPYFRQLLLSRRKERRKEALKQLQSVYENVSEAMVEEVAKRAKACERQSWLRWLRVRPFLGYSSACASLQRTMVDHVLPEQAGSRVALQKRDRNGTQRLRYVLRDDAMEGENSTASTEGSQESGVVDAPSKARAMFVLLRQLLDASAWDLEAVAVKSAQEQAGSEDWWLTRTPDLETPDYEVLLRDPSGAFEIRQYKPYSVVRMADGNHNGTQVGGTSSFFALANYIFGKANVKQEKMAMTTPVQTEKESGVMSFIMPSRYWSNNGLNDAPEPSDGSGVALEARPSETLAVSIFGGYARGGVVQQKIDALLASVSEDERLEVVDATATRLMQYNDPFTVPWKRRNEVSVPVRMK